MRILLCLLPLLFVGCITPSANENPKTVDELRTILRDFHMKLRWGLWEQAAAYTSPEYRNEFLGRYEELGEDFKIVNIEVKSVTLGEPLSTVDVEQESYEEPDMVVQKKRYIETWLLAHGTWRITERIPKEEWRARQKETPEDEPAEPSHTTGGEPQPSAPPSDEL